MFVGVITFTIALVTSFALTIPVRRLALHIGFIDEPNTRKLHQTSMPLLGGLAIYCGTVVSIMFSLDGQPRGQIFGIVAGGTLLLVTGILDDRGLLHHQIKLFVAMPLAATTLVALGVRFHIASEFLPGALANGVDVALTLLWVVGITAAFSILDHMDGLVSGVAAIASFFFALLAILNGQMLVAPLGAAVFGASLGFLRWNFKPAKIFMGDGGAMFLGFMMATLGLKLRPTGMPQAIAWIVPVLVLGVPIFDTTLVSISRARRGLIPFASPGKDHTAHRLANLRLGQRGAVLVIYAGALLFGMLAVVISRYSFGRPLLAGVVLVLAALVGVGLLENLPYERQQPSRETS
ncbi:MAG TPA: MraY family glycosyltransferase [Terriglobia bacterium]|nr:MraY family glycosyltransferase [Terriglobia bacterium]